MSMPSVNPILRGESRRFFLRWLRNGNLFARLLIVLAAASVIAVAWSRRASACEAEASARSLPAIAFDVRLPTPMGQFHLRHQLVRLGFTDVEFDEPAEPNADCMGGSIRFSASSSRGCASYVGIVCYPGPPSRRREVRVDWWMLD